MDPLLSNAVHIARYRSKNPLPARSRDDVTSAYGAQEMVKLTRLLRHEETMTRDQALVALQSALQKPQLRASGVHAGLVPALQVRPRRPPRPRHSRARGPPLVSVPAFRRCARTPHSTPRG